MNFPHSISKRETLTEYRVFMMRKRWRERGESKEGERRERGEGKRKERDRQRQREGYLP